MCGRKLKSQQENVRGDRKIGEANALYNLTFFPYQNFHAFLNILMAGKRKRRTINNLTSVDQFYINKPIKLGKIAQFDYVYKNLIKK
jgi:hypothetical protein